MFVYSGFWNMFLMDLKFTDFLQNYLKKKNSWFCKSIFHEHIYLF